MSRCWPALRELLRDAGAAFIGGGLHPDVEYGDVVHVETERYQAIRDEMRGLVSRTPTAALHVHVGMPDPETAIHVCNRMRVHLPLLQALAAHSPFWFGRRLRAGVARRSAMFRAFPRSRVPQAFHGLGALPGGHPLVRGDGGGPRLHVRVVGHPPEPEPRHGRGARDGRAEPARERRRARRARARARRRLRGRRGGDRAADRGRSPSPRSAPRATGSTRRSGGAARLRPIREVGADALAIARPYARELDGEDALEEIERILREGGGADRMRAAHAAGGMDEVLAQLARESYGSTQTTSPIRSQS